MGDVRKTINLLRNKEMPGKINDTLKYRVGELESVVKELDDKIIEVKSRPESLIEQGHFYQKLEGMGLPNEDIRGDLFIRYIVNFPRIEKIEKLCDGHDYENNDYYENDFTNIDNHFELKNCPYENVYYDDNV